VRILVAEDDDRTANYLVRGLIESGHIVDRVADGETALAMALEGIYEALVLDRMLPAMDGLTLVRRLREHDPRLPVLMLSAVASTADRVEGMRAGCDDYLTKPYVFVELLARLEALGRRADRSRRLAVLRVGDLELDTVGRYGRDGRSRSNVANSCCWNSWSATPARSLRAPCCWKPPGIMISRHVATSSTCISTGCEKKSMRVSLIR